MSKKIIFIFLLLCLSTFISLTFAYASEDNYWRTMTYQHVSKDINPNSSLTFYIEEGRNSDIKKWEYIMPDIGWKFKTPLIYMPAASITYRHVYVRKNDKWEKNEKRYNLNLFFTLPEVKNYKLKNRIRFEYRDLDTWEDWRIRNEFTISFPYSFTKYKIQPHLIDEIYYDFHNNHVSVNEVWLKITACLTENVVTCFGYRWALLNNEPKWTQYHMLTIGISIKIP